MREIRRIVSAAAHHEFTHWDQLDGVENLAPAGPESGLVDRDLVVQLPLQDFGFPNPIIRRLGEDLSLPVMGPLNRLHRGVFGAPGIQD